MLILLILLNAGRLTAHAQPRKVIIDCDPGIDDALDLILAFQYPGIEIVGITTVAGNAHVDVCTKNALRVVELSGKNIPVFQGAQKSLVVPVPPPPDWVHGKDGLGNTNQPEPKISAQQKPAAQFIVDITSANPGQITIFALGKLTNLAEAIKLDSNVTKNVKEGSCRGRSTTCSRSCKSGGRTNIWGDPHAADMVFTAPWKITMFGLDVTMKPRLSDELLLRIKNKNTKYGPFIYSITRFLRDFQMTNLQVDAITQPGASAVIYLMDSIIFNFAKGPVRVVTEGIAIGQTIMPAYAFQIQIDPWKGKPLVSAAMDVDVERYLKTYEAIMVQKQR